MTMPSGEQHYMAKRSGLTWADVDAIRAMHADGMKQRRIAALYPRISHVMVHKIVTGKAWNKR